MLPAVVDALALLFERNPSTLTWAFVAWVVFALLDRVITTSAH